MARTPAAPVIGPARGPPVTGRSCVSCRERVSRADSRGSHRGERALQLLGAAALLHEATGVTTRREALDRVRRVTERASARVSRAAADAAWAAGCACAMSRMSRMSRDAAIALARPERW
jgi:hypothetical protein